MDPEIGRALMLAGVLPAGVDRYVALYLGNPSTVEGVELTLTGYARVAHQDWTTTVPGVGESERSNASPILFPTISQAGSADYWGIFDAAVAGNLLRFGSVTDLLGAPTPVVFTGAGEDARFLIGAIRVSQRDV
jgi:hypothetical protein